MLSAKSNDLKKYLKEVESLQNESAKSHRFSMLLQQLLGSRTGFIEKYSSGIEKYIRHKETDQIVRGRADNLFGNVIIEFEYSIPEMLDEAKEQLQRYTSIIWNEEGPDSRTGFLLIATDGVRFYSFSPICLRPSKTQLRPDDIKLYLLEQSDWAELSSDDILLWCDRYFVRRELLKPTSDRIVSEFGAESHALLTLSAELTRVWREVKTESAYKVVYDSWDEFLRIVYGSKVAGEELFIKHTYLATLAKLLAWIRLSGSDKRPSKNTILDILLGRYFHNQGIENFLEEDFFSWIGRNETRDTGTSMVLKLYSLLQNYDLRALSEDVLKSLYQELVDPETRHDLGEFYTPDWLAHSMVLKELKDDPTISIFDPACGSGTFLYFSILEKIRKLGKSKKTLRHVLDTIHGADIHPLAVIIAKTNYVLALGDLLFKRDKITIPVYLSDTLKPPERWAGVGTDADYAVPIDSKPLYIPRDMTIDAFEYDTSIQLANEYATAYSGKAIDQASFKLYLKKQGLSRCDDDRIVSALFAIAKRLKVLIEKGRDSIWSFVLRNIFKPVFLNERFDLLIGNPPWLTYNLMDSNLQTFVKSQSITLYGLLPKSSGHLVTHLELSALFTVRATDLYLKPGGRMAFVMPRSVISADQHDNFREGRFKLALSNAYYLQWQEIWDCDDVRPLFKVPSCVVFGNKNKRFTKYPIPGLSLSGRLPSKNCSLKVSESHLSSTKHEWHLNKVGKRTFLSDSKLKTISGNSHYKTLFREGATMVPRSFWFVDVIDTGVGINPELPLLRSSKRARSEAKPQYKTVDLNGTIEGQFLYSTLLSVNLIPFGNLRMSLVMLPIDQIDGIREIISAAKSSSRGYIHLAAWLESIELEWKRRRSGNAKNTSSIEWLDYQRKLGNQLSGKQHRVIYPSSGGNSVAAVISRGPQVFKIGEQEIFAKESFVDHATLYFETNCLEEAHYLCSVINSSVLIEIIKPMMAKGLFGPRHIYKKILEIPIPKFDNSIPEHKTLSLISMKCHDRIRDWISIVDIDNVSQTAGRRKARQLLESELKTIDNLVETLLRI